MMDVAELGDYITRHFTRTLFRLETLSQYEVASDGTDFARYLDGETGPDPARKQPWLDHLRNEVSRGLYRHRVHVLCSPLSDYLRYECEWGYAYNEQAGEDIRILDRTERPDPGDLVDHDFWLIDDSDVLRMHYGPFGQYLGAELMPEREVERYRAARDAAWQAAEPFALYWSAHPQFRRGAGAAWKGSV